MTTAINAPANFTFIWKLIDGDKFEQDFNGCDSLNEAVTLWARYWGITWNDCEEFTVIKKDN
jgi:hypothetical protein